MNPIIFRENEYKTSDSIDLLSEVLQKYISSRAVMGQISSAPWLDVGTPERLKLANTIYNDQN